MKAVVITLPIYCNSFKVTKEGQPLGYEGGEKHLISKMLIICLINIY